MLITFADRPSDSPFIERGFGEVTATGPGFSLHGRVSLGHGRHAAGGEDVSHRARAGNEGHDGGPSRAGGEWFECSSSWALSCRCCGPAICATCNGFPDYKPELPGGRPTGGRSLNAKPFDLARLGEWRDRITSFPADFSNVGIDAETRARIHAAVDSEAGDYCVAGTALIAGLLKGLLDLGVTPHTEARALELIADDGGIVGVRIHHDGKDIRVRARAGGRAGHRRVRMG